MNVSRRIPSLCATRQDNWIKFTSRHSFVGTECLGAFPGLKLSFLKRRNFSTAMGRLMFPSHANPAGNVHGGTILELIDEAGTVEAMRFLNKNSQKDIQHHGLGMALARIERMGFREPVFVGELAQLKADVVYNSNNSIRICVKVAAEDLLSGKQRETNKATLWYVPVRTSSEAESNDEIEVGKNKVAKGVLPPPNQTSPDVESEMYHAAYLKLKDQRQKTLLDLKPIAIQMEPGTKNTGYLAQWIQPDDCLPNGNAKGGSILKLIDNCGALAALRHSGTNVVTATVEALDFLSPVRLGELVELESHIVFTSSKSIETLVLCYTTNLETGARRLAVKANLVFVGLDENNSVVLQSLIEVPQDSYLKSEYEAAKERYELRKRPNH